MKLLLIAPFSYGPSATHGGAAAGWAQLQALRPRHTLSLVAFESPGPLEAGSRGHADALAAQGIRYTGVRRDESRMRRRLARGESLLTHMPIEAVAYRSRLMRDAIRRERDAFQPDAIVIQFPQMAQYVGDCEGTPAFMDVHDAQSVSAFRRIATMPTRRLRMEQAADWLRWVRYERRLYPRFRGVLTPSPQDLYGLRAFTPELRAEAVGFPVDIPSLSSEPRRGTTIRFVGNYAHGPNVVAVEHFLAAIFPRILTRRPDVRFEAAGVNAPAGLFENGGEQVRYVGYVEDLATFLAQAGVVAIPLLSGGGVKVKTLEALAAGAAVVSTAIGVEGIAAEDGTHFRLGAGPAEFADAVLTLLDRPDVAARLGAEARQLMVRDWAGAAWEHRFTRFIADHLDDTLPS